MTYRPVITVRTACQMLGVSSETIRRYLADGTLEGFLLPGQSRWRIFRESVERLIAPDQQVKS